MLTKNCRTRRRLKSCANEHVLLHAKEKDYAVKTGIKLLAAVSCKIISRSDKCSQVTSEKKNPSQEPLNAVHCVSGLERTIEFEITSVRSVA